VSIQVIDGFIRLSAHHRDQFSETTLALMSPMEGGGFLHPKGCNLQLEALSESTLTIQYGQEFISQQDDFLTEWLMELHIARRPVKADERIFESPEASGEQAREEDKRRLHTQFFTVSFKACRNHWHNAFNSQPLHGKTERKRIHLDRRVKRVTHHQRLNRQKDSNPTGTSLATATARSTFPLGTF